MKDRHLTQQVLDALADTPVVFVQGPRQAGKTTLAQSLRVHGYPAEYRTLDDAIMLAAARNDPDGFVDALPERVILDDLPRLLRLIAARASGVLNLANLACDAHLPLNHAATALDAVGGGVFCPNTAGLERQSDITRGQSAETPAG